MVVHACNLTYLEDWGRGIASLRFIWAKQRIQDYARQLNKTLFQNKHYKGMGMKVHSGNEPSMYKAVGSISVLQKQTNQQIRHLIIFDIKYLIVFDLVHTTKPLL